MPDGTLVGEDSVITKKQADDLFTDRLHKEFEAGVKRNCKVLLTQSMYDSLVSMAYNMGVGGLFD
jgi:GH24 family phage-related lysozyme (muramidase)